MSLPLALSPSVAVAADVLYDASLATAVAHRVAEARSPAISDDLLVPSPQYLQDASPRRPAPRRRRRAAAGSSWATRGARGARHSNARWARQRVKKKGRKEGGVSSAHPRLGPRPLIPERRLRSLEACGGLSSSPRASQTMRCCSLSLSRLTRQAGGAAPLRVRAEHGGAAQGGGLEAEGGRPHAHQPAARGAKRALT